LLKEQRAGDLRNIADTQHITLEQYFSQRTMPRTEPAGSGTWVFSLKFATKFIEVSDLRDWRIF
jgi:hypothetical protein